jgi:cold-inducible RNA-binding protein
MNTKVYISNLAATITERDLQALFCAHGNVAEINLRVGPERGGPHPFAIVSMATPQGAQAAILALDGKEVAGRTLAVVEYVPARHLPSGPGQNGNGPGSAARRVASASPHRFGVF